MLHAGKPRVSMAGCGVAVSQCLTGGFVLSLSGCSDGKKGYGRGWGLGGRAGTANSVNLSWILAFPSILPPFPLSSSFFLQCIVSLVSFYPRHRQRQLGPVPRWHVTAGLSEPATEVTWHSGWAWVEKTRSLKERAVPFSRGFLFFCVWKLIHIFWSHLILFFIEPPNTSLSRQQHTWS